MMLDEGITSQGAASRSFDKYGKRQWKATPKMDNSKKHQVIGGGGSVESQTHAVSSDKKTTTADVGGL